MPHRLPFVKKEEGSSMTITLTALLIWLIIAAIVGFLGEALAGRRGLSSWLGAMLVGLLAIFLVVGVLHFSLSGEPFLEGVPLLSSILAAMLLVLLWSFVGYHRMAPASRRSRGWRGWRRRRWLR
jgi:uncharacterized membrane protein YeaQ/YmgE (transglycosylase-associated protein family)